MGLSKQGLDVEGLTQSGTSVWSRAPGAGERPRAQWNVSQAGAIRLQAEARSMRTVETWETDREPAETDFPMMQTLPISQAKRAAWTSII